MIPKKKRRKIVVNNTIYYYCVTGGYKWRSVYIENSITKANCDWYGEHIFTITPKQIREEIIEKGI